MAKLDKPQSLFAAAAPPQKGKPVPAGKPVPPPAPKPVVAEDPYADTPDELSQVADESVKLSVIEPGGAVRTAGGYALDDVGTGFEDFTQDDVAVPFIAILQKGSPQVEEDNPKFLEGAKPGMLFNTVTNELYDGKTTGITVIPVHRARVFIEWIPKDDGGGLVNVFQPDASEVVKVLKAAGRAFGKLKIGDGNDLVETFSLFCLMVKPDGRTERVVISFASSQIGVYKRWMTMAQSIQIPDGSRTVVPPLFSHQYTITTSFTQKKDFTWYKFAVDFKDGAAEAGRIPQEDPLFEQAKNFRALVMRGQARANFESAAAEHMGAQGGEADYEM